MKSKSPILDGAMERMKSDHCLPTTISAKSYTLTMSVWHGSYKNAENATGDSIENVLATLVKTSMGIGYGPKLGTEQFHDVCRSLSEFGTAQHGWADYAMTGPEPYTDDPSVTAFDAAHGDKITASPKAANVQPLKPELDEEPTHTPGLWTIQIRKDGLGALPDRNSLEIVHNYPDGSQQVIVGKHTGIDCLNMTNAKLIAASPDLLAAAQTLIAGCEAHLAAQGYALQISGMIATRAAIERAKCKIP